MTFALLKRPSLLLTLSLAPNLSLAPTLSLALSFRYAHIYFLHAARKQSAHHAPFVSQHDFVLPCLHTNNIVSGPSLYVTFYMHWFMIRFGSLCAAFLTFVERTKKNSRPGKTIIRFSILKFAWVAYMPLLPTDGKLTNYSSSDSFSLV